MEQDQDFRTSRGLFLGNQVGSLRSQVDALGRKKIRDGEFESSKDLRAMEIWARDGFVSIPGHSVELGGDRGNDTQRQDEITLPLGSHIEQEGEEEDA